MKRKALKLHYITLLIFCQALAFFAFAKPTKAAVNELTISCPTESTANTEITCTISGKTSSEINAISATINLTNLQIKNIQPSSGWTNNGSATSSSLSLTASTAAKNAFTLGTITISSASADQAGIISLENIEFKNNDAYHFNAVGSSASINITAAPVTPTCATDEELVDGKCVKKQKICNADEELINGECVKKTPTCAIDEELVDGKCVKKTTECSENEELIEGKCVEKETICKEGEELVEGKCVEKTITCKDDEKLVEGKCVKKTKTCKTDEELIDGKCVKKIVTPVCNTDEELIDNKCQKIQQGPDWTLIAIIVGGAILIIGIIVAIILIVKKGKKGSGSSIKGFTNFGESSKVSTGYFPPTNAQASSYLSSTDKTALQSTASAASSSTQSTNNGTFLAQSGTITETNIEPKENTDPRFKMNIPNPTLNPQAKTTHTNNPLTNEIGKDSALGTYDDPRLQYNFSQSNQTIPQTQPQAQQPQTPVLSVYNIATQAAAQPEETPQQTIQQATQATSAQPIGPVANQNTFQSQAYQTQQYRPTASVPLTAPNDPTVFES